MGGPAPTSCLFDGFISLFEKYVLPFFFLNLPFFFWRFELEFWVKSRQKSQTYCRPYEQQQKEPQCWQKTATRAQMFAKQSPKKLLMQ